MATTKRTTAALLVGFVTGLVFEFATFLVATLDVPGPFTTHPLVLLLLAVLAALAVGCGWRWPAVGATAGVVALLIVVFAVVQGVTWSTGTTRPFNPFDAVGFGAVSGYPAMIGAALVASSSLRSWSRRESEKAG
ncbi:hypothetical protein [Curtobacterium pusillum]|uniref:hypothetical protein n=1 Tax=Curtobacterium pusillum TaxID=69373 RepID=UPI0011A226ED|nr:hypothetical protein [Curtobacterium pusillum]